MYYKASGYGTLGSGFYLDPLGEPIEWLSQFVVRAPLLLLGQWFVPPAALALSWTDAQVLAFAVCGVGVMGLVWGWYSGCCGRSCARMQPRGSLPAGCCSR